MITIQKSGIHITRADALLITPYKYDATLNDYVLGDNTYDLQEIIGNSIEITQDDNETIVKRNEFSPKPILQNIIKGNWKFSATCIDFANPIMKDIYGFHIAKDINNEFVENTALYNDESEQIYVCIRIRLKDARLPDIVLPKVALSSQITINNLKNGFANGKIEGISEEHRVNVFKKAQALNYGNRLKIYNPMASLLFVPRDYQLSLYKQINGNYEEYVCENDGTIKLLNPINGYVK